MTIFALTDADGRVLAFHDATLHAAIPPGSFPIPAETWTAWIADTAGQRWDGTALVPCDPPPSPPAPPIRRIRTLAFRRRLSPASRAAITLAASQAMEGGSAELQMFLDDLAASREVDLDDPEIAAGVATLRGAGLVTPAEAAALLADGTPAETA
ncbi:hypothetical protein [Falsiroseomonas sp. CW058]|uniref:hypothetical protein n=1 Tax=Falsiroseomonas sp. CW058 TaxID=3388664 RepID=UPI003D31F581